MTEPNIEIEDIVIEFEGNIDLDTLADKKIAFLEMGSKAPVMKTDTKLYKIAIQDSIGTKLLFKDRDGELEYYAKTDKDIRAHRFMIKPK